MCARVLVYVCECVRVDGTGAWRCGLGTPRPGGGEGGSAGVNAAFPARPGPGRAGAQKPIDSLMELAPGLQTWPPIIFTEGPVGTETCSIF